MGRKVPTPPDELDCEIAMYRALGYSYDTIRKITGLTPGAISNRTKRVERYYEGSIPEVAVVEMMMRRPRFRKAMKPHIHAIASE